MTTDSSGATQDQPRDIFAAYRAVAIIGTALYTAAALYKSLHHVFWLDEWVVWLIGKMQPSVWDVIRSVRYDGHPPLWYIAQHGLSRICGDPAISKVAHVAIASCSVFVILRYGPFSLAEKILLPLGYFFFFEYSTITRSYAPAILLALIAAVLFPSAGRRPIRYAILLLLIGQWSLFGMILSLALAAGVAQQWRENPRPGSWKIAAAIMVASLVVFYFSTRLPNDAAGQDAWLNDWRHLHFSQSAARLFDAYIPLPKLSRGWWNSQMIALPDVLRGTLAAAMLWITVQACRSRKARTILLTGTAITFGVILIVYAGSMRHWGHYFIVLLLSVWIDRRLSPCDPPRWVNRAFLALLTVQAAGGLFASALDLRQPFSTSVQAAEVIRTAGNNLPLAGDYDFSMVPLAGLLNRPIFFIRSGQPGWIVRFDRSRKRNVTLAMITGTVHDLAVREHSDVILVMTYPVALPKTLEQIADIPASSVGDERYLIYRYRLPVRPIPFHQAG